MSELLLVLDFGGTKHTLALLERGQSEWMAHERVFSPPGADARYDLDTVRQVSRKLLNGAQPAAIGVSFGGPVIAAEGRVRLSHHVPGWENIPLREILEDEFAAPASVDNDGNVGALGEHRFGAGRGLDSLLYITVSTGVGGGWILNGKLWHGWESMAGEFGHIMVDPEGPVCVCGNRGCVERLASGPFIAQRAREWMTANPVRGRVLHQIIDGDLEKVSAKLVAEAAAQDDDLAWESLRVAGWALGTGIGVAANLINPQRFVLGGGVTKSGERFWNEIRRVARETAMPEVHFEIVPAQLGDDAPLWGAVALAEDVLSAHGEITNS